MTVWRMNLKDDRSIKDCNADKELKFRICLEKSILAIGWGLNATFDNWTEYKKFADWHYQDDIGYHTAVKYLKKMKRGDLVWIKNPVTDERYLAQIVDDVPSLCSYLKEFDMYSYRKANIFSITSDLFNKFDIPFGSKYKRRSHTIEQVNKQPIVDETIKVFDSIK
jgi:hypothetical protein